MLPSVLFILMALALVVYANPLNLTFPSNWEEDFTLYTTHNRPDNGQVRYLYANALALEGARQGEELLPEGSALLMETLQSQG